MDTLNRDIKVKLLMESDPKTLLNLCRTDKSYNRICSDENFWRRRYTQDYGAEAASFKNPDRTWRNYYLMTLYYDEKYYPFEALEQVSKKGYHDLVKYFTFLDNWGIQYVSIWAAEGGHEALAREYLGSTYDRGFVAAKALVGNLVDLYSDLQNDIIPLNAQHLVAFHAAEKGHSDILQDMLDNAGASPAMALAGAIKGQRWDLVDMLFPLLKRFPNPDRNDIGWLNILDEAVKQGNMTLINRVWTAASEDEDFKWVNQDWLRDLFTVGINASVESLNSDLLHHYFSEARKAGFPIPFKEGSEERKHISFSYPITYAINEGYPRSNERERRYMELAEELIALQPMDIDPGKAQEMGWRETERILNNLLVRHQR